MAPHQARPLLFRLALPLVLALPLAACGSDTLYNRGLQAARQPVVQHSYFLFDVQQDSMGSLNAGERNRLNGWLDSLDVGYGDNVAIATDDSYVTPAMREALADILGRRGMLINEDASAQAGRPAPGSVRLILRRATASVPGCPNWSDTAEASLTSATSRNFGCATNGNLAAMIANPDDLVRGQQTDSAYRTDISTRAIRTLREKEPTGAGGLQSLAR